MELFSFCPRNLFYFEFPLNGKNKWMDISIQLSMLTASLKTKKMTFFDLFSTLAMTQSQTWKNIAFFLDRYEDQLFKHGVEIDTGSDSKWPPLPNLFISTMHEPLTLIKNAAQTLQKPLSKKTIYNLQNFLESSPSGVFIFGFMLARPCDAVRYIFRGHENNFEFIEEHFKNFKHISHLHPLHALFQKLKMHLDKASIALDVGDQIYPHIGIECFGKQEHWPAILSLLRKEKMITHARGKACLNWIGASVEESTSDNFYFLEKNICHIKLMYRPDQPISAKIYLSLGRAQIPLFQFPPSYISEKA